MIILVIASYIKHRYIYRVAWWHFPAVIAIGTLAFVEFSLEVFLIADVVRRCLV